MTKITTVDEYIKNSPSKIQDKLIELRKIIQGLAPEAEEKLSYGMPYYGYKGKLIYFAYFKHHIGIYIPTPTIEEHQTELKNYVTAKATVQFPLDKKLPITLIKKLVKSRIKYNEEKSKK